MDGVDRTDSCILGGRLSNTANHYCITVRSGRGGQNLRNCNCASRRGDMSAKVNVGW